MEYPETSTFFFPSSVFPRVWDVSHHTANVADFLTEWSSTGGCELPHVFPSPCCKYCPCKKTERCNFPILAQIRSRCGYFHISVNTLSCLLAEGARCRMRHRVRRCYGRCHTKEVRGDALDLSHLHFIIKILMDHSRKSLQSFQLLLLDVVLDILGTSMAHLCLVSTSGEL